MFKVCIRYQSMAMLDKNQMLSVNQIMVHIKLTEMWKSKNVEIYPLKPLTVQPLVNGTMTRSAASEKFSINCTPNTFIGDATRLWKQAPKSVTEATNLKSAKSNVKSYCRSLPI